MNAVRQMRIAEWHGYILRAEVTVWPSAITSDREFVYELEASWKKYRQDDLTAEEQGQILEDLARRGDIPVQVEVHVEPVSIIKRGNDPFPPHELEGYGSIYFETRRWVGLWKAEAEAGIYRAGEFIILEDWEEEGIQLTQYEKNKR